MQFEDPSRQAVQVTSNLVTRQISKSVRRGFLLPERGERNSPTEAKEKILHDPKLQSMRAFNLGCAVSPWSGWSLPRRSHLGRHTCLRRTFTIPFRMSSSVRFSCSTFSFTVSLTPTVVPCIHRFRKSSFLYAVVKEYRPLFWDQRTIPLLCSTDNIPCATRCSKMVPSRLVSSTWA
jgi:hypothetical protein